MVGRGQCGQNVGVLWEPRASKRDGQDFEMDNVDTTTISTRVSRVL